MKTYKNSKYIIYPDGKVVNSETGKILKSNNNGKGHLKHHLIIDGKRKVMYVHRLVAELYVKKPRKRHCNQVNHIDGDKSNNHKDNLEWMTNGENQIHAHKTGLKPKAKLNKMEVQFIRRSKKDVKILAEKFRVCKTTIYNVKNRKIYKYF